MGRITMHPTSYGAIKIIGQAGHIYIGKYCSIADDVRAIMIGHNPGNISTFPFNKINNRSYPTAQGSKSHPIRYGNINIENDVWIGYGATIFGGITIGNGAVIAAESVVANNVAPYSIVAGNPSIRIKNRFPEVVIRALLEIKWWNWEESKIQEEAGLLCSENIQLFLQKHRVMQNGN